MRFTKSPKILKKFSRSKFFFSNLKILNILLIHLTFSNSFEYNTRFEQATKTTFTTKKCTGRSKSTTTTKTSTSRTSAEGKSSYKIHNGLCFEVVESSSQMDYTSAKEDETKDEPADLPIQVYEMRTRSKSQLLQQQQVQEQVLNSEDNDYSNIDYHMMPCEKPGKSRFISYSPLDSPESRHEKAAKREHSTSSSARTPRYQSNKQSK